MKWKDESDDKKKDRAAKAPLPVLYGGIVPPPLTPPAAQQVVLDGAGAVVSDQRNSAEGGVLSGTAVAVPGNSGAGGAGAPENLGQGTAAPSSSGEGLRAPGNLPSDTGEIVPANPGPGAAAASVAAPGRTDQAVGSVK